MQIRYAPITNAIISVFVTLIFTAFELESLL